MKATMICAVGLAILAFSADQLRSEGHSVDDGDVVHLSPARYAHINPMGSITLTSKGNLIAKAFAR
jgi:hypothetical protein